MNLDYKYQVFETNDNGEIPSSIRKGIKNEIMEQLIEFKTESIGIWDKDFWTKDVIIQLAAIFISGLILGFIIFKVTNDISYNFINAGFIARSISSFHRIADNIHYAQKRFNRMSVETCFFGAKPSFDYLNLAMEKDFHSEYLSISYNEFILHEERELFENTTKHEYDNDISGGSGLFGSIKENDGSRSPDRPFYVPIKYISPLEGNEMVIGFDLTSIPNRNDTLFTARSQGYAETTPRLLLVQNGKPSVLIFAPLYIMHDSKNCSKIQNPFESENDLEDSGTFIGWMTFVFNFESLDYSLEYEFYFFDERESHDCLLYTNGPEITDPDHCETYLSESPGYFVYSENIEFSPNTNFKLVIRDLKPVTIFLPGLFFFLSVLIFTTSFGFVVLQYHLYKIRTQSYVQMLIEANSFLKKEQRKVKESAEREKLIISALSHEMRTPLFSLIGTVELMDFEMYPKLKPMLETLNLISTYLINLVTNILEFNKNESKKFMIDTKSFYLKNIIDEAIKINFNFIKDLKLDIDITYTDSIKTELFIGDKFKITQVLSNLLNNAIKHNLSNGRIWIKMDLISLPNPLNAKNIFNFREKEIKMFKSLTRDQKYLYCSVIDEGPGIRIEKIDNIFYPFTQIISKDSNIGSGLGLAICRQICEILGGMIWLEDSQNSGSKFSFLIPKQSEKQLRASPKSFNEDDISLDLIEPNTKVLVVDDIEMNASLVKEMLKIISENLQVDLAYTKEMTIEKVFNNHYSLIFMDLWLFDDLDGFELTKQLKQDSPNQNSYFIVHTADMNAVTDSVNYYSQLFNYKCLKPLSIEQLKKVIKNYLYNRDLSNKKL